MRNPKGKKEQKVEKLANVEKKCERSEKSPKVPSIKEWVKLCKESNHPNRSNHVIVCTCSRVQNKSQQIGLK